MGIVPFSRYAAVPNSSFRVLGSKKQKETLDRNGKYSNFLAGPLLGVAPPHITVKLGFHMDVSDRDDDDASGTFLKVEHISTIHLDGDMTGTRGNLIYTGFHAILSVTSSIVDPMDGTRPRR